MAALDAAGDPPPDSGACRFGRNAAPAIRPLARCSISRRVQSARVISQVSGVRPCYAGAGGWNRTAPQPDDPDFETKAADKPGGRAAGARSAPGLPAVRLQVRPFPAVAQEPRGPPPRR